MIGKLEQVKDSQSGKTLSVLVGGTWYSTKNWEFRQMVGQEIEFTPSSSEFQGKMMHWLNDYVKVGGEPTQAPPTPPADSYTEAYGKPQTTKAPVSPSKDRDASIVAQALTKASCTPGEPVQAVWSRYTEFYNKYMDWNPGDFDDSVPY